MEPHDEDLQPEPEGFAESFAESDSEQTWYFDLPDGAWDRQEQKNRSLRDTVRQNVQQSDAREAEAAKRDPFRAKPNATSREPRPSSWTLNRRTSGNLAEEPIAWTDNAPVEDGPAPAGMPWGVQQPEPARPSDALKLRPVRRDDEDDFSVSAPPVEADEEARSVVDAMRGWSSLATDSAKRRPILRGDDEPATPPPAPAGEGGQATADPLGGWSSLRKKPTPAEGGAESRWDQIFAGPTAGGGAVVDSMREWASAPPPPDPDNMPTDINDLPAALLKPFDWEEPVADASAASAFEPAFLRPEAPPPSMPDARMPAAPAPEEPIAWEPFSATAEPAWAAPEDAVTPAPVAWGAEAQAATGWAIDDESEPPAPASRWTDSSAHSPEAIPQPVSWGGSTEPDDFAPAAIAGAGQPGAEQPEPKKKGLFGKLFGKSKEQPKASSPGPEWADAGPSGWLAGDNEAPPEGPPGRVPWTQELPTGGAWELDEPPTPVAGIANWGTAPEETGLQWTPVADDLPVLSDEPGPVEAPWVPSPGTESPPAGQPVEDDWEEWRHTRAPRGVERDMSGAALDEPLPVAELAANRFHFGARQEWNDDWLENPGGVAGSTPGSPEPAENEAAEPLPFPATAWRGEPDADQDATEAEDERAVEAPLTFAPLAQELADAPDLDEAAAERTAEDAGAPVISGWLSAADSADAEPAEVTPLFMTDEPAGSIEVDDAVAWAPAPATMEPEDLGWSVPGEPASAIEPPRAFAFGWREPPDDSGGTDVDLALPGRADSEPETLHAEVVMEDDREGTHGAPPSEPDDRERAARLEPPPVTAWQPEASPAPGPPGPPGGAPDDPWAAFIRTREDDGEGTLPFASPATAETGAPVSWESHFAPGDKSEAVPAEKAAPTPTEDDPWGAIVAASGYDEKPEHSSVYLGKREAASMDDREPVAAQGTYDTAPFELPVPTDRDDEPAEFNDEPAAAPASSAWYQDDEDDVVLRAFEEHARSEIREAPPAFDDASDDAFEPLLGKHAAEIVEEASEPIERPFFSAVPSWAPPASAGAPAEPAPWTPPAARAFEESQRGWAEHDPAEQPQPRFAAGAGFEDDFYGDDPLPLPAPAPKDTRGRTLIRELVETGLLALLVFLAVRASFQNFKVDGSSMFPTLEDGQFLIVNKLVYSEVDLDKMGRFLPFLDGGDDPKRHVFHPPERGDIIVLVDPSNPKIDLIKRVVGLPGETIEIVEGRVYINDKQLEEPYIKQAWHGNNPKITIPAGEYFVMGDNRDNSQDSRSARVGLVPEELIIGKTFLSYWPMGQFGLAPNGDPKVTDVLAPRARAEAPK